MTLVALLGTGVAAAQRRPPLPAGADSNDSAAYIQLAQSILQLPIRGDPAVAESALVWAARLDPGSADPSYQRAIAILQPVLFRAYLAGARGLRRLRRDLTPARLQLVDSLMRAAWVREPFYDLELDPRLTFGPRPSPRAARNAAERAWLAYRRGELQLAADSWGEALTREPTRIDLRLHRAHTFHALGLYDSTAAELERAIASVSPEPGEGTIVLPPTYMFHYALGVVRERAGHVDAARDAYARALVENLGLYMARVRLANLLWVQGDTAAGLAEVALAVDVQPREPWLVGYYGYMFVQTGRYAEALPHLLAAVALDPHYATPYLLLGIAHEKLGQSGQALHHYQTFLARARRSDERRAWVEPRLAVLRRASADSVPR